jgi:hypothetical protein
MGPNGIPTTTDDTYTVAANGTLTVDVTHGVLANDADPDGDPLIICDQPRLEHHEVMLAPRNGTVTMNADGSFSYTPNAGFVGVDTFYYCIEDRWSCCQGKVTINVTGGQARAETFATNGNASVGTEPHSFSVMPDLDSQRGSVMSSERVSLASSFNLTFQINVGNDDNGADGMAFVLHNDPLGNHALGGGGGAMGALNLHNGLAIQFDTFQNAGDPNDIANDHTSFMDTDSEAVLSPITDLGNIEDGNWHTVSVAWDGTTLSYTFDGNLAGTLTGDIAADYLGGSQYAYFGITGATGGLSHPGDVRLLSLEATAEDGAALRLVEASRAATFVTNGNASVGTEPHSFSVMPDWTHSTAA